MDGLTTENTIPAVDKDQRGIAGSSGKRDKVKDGREVNRQTLYGICNSCMQSDCAMLVHLENGIIVNVEGNPEAPPNYGKLCGRGLAMIMSLYNPYRIKSPLVRTNPEKGLDIDPKWKEVSWEEALDLVARRLSEVREKNPRGLVVFEGFGEKESILRRSFVRAFGTPNEVGSHGPICTVHYASSLVHAGFPTAIVDLEYCQYHVTIGRSLGPNFATVAATKRFTKALDRGMKLIVVDPRCSPEASKGEWVPIRPGTDLAFLLAMTHVMLHENLPFDEWFIKHRTNAPYLIGPDGNYVRGEQNGKPVMWDPIKDCAKSFDLEFEDIALTGEYQVNNIQCRTAFDIVREEFAKYTPEWAEKICTVPAKIIRRIAYEFVEHARIGSTIEIDGFTFPFRPVSLNTERMVVAHRGGTYADLTGKLINMLVGNIEVPGGLLSNSYRGPLLAPTEDGVVKPSYEAIPRSFRFPPKSIDGASFYPHKHTTPHLAIKAILEPEKYYLGYEVKAVLTIGSNPIRKCTQPHEYVEAFKKIPFHVAVSYHMDEPAILADVVLPEHSAMERFRLEVMKPPHQSTDGALCGLHLVQFRQPVEACFNTKHVDEILIELAERLGILYGESGLYDRLNNSVDPLIFSDGLNLNSDYKLDIDKKHTVEEISEKMLKGWPHNKEDYGIEELCKKGFLEHRVSKKLFYNYYYFPDDKTRHPFYFQALKTVGEQLRNNMTEHNITFPGIDDSERVFDLYKPVPHWVENSELNAPPEFDLWAINWRTPYYSNDASNVIGNPWLAELYMKDPYDAALCINPVTAKKKGLKDGDLAVVESRYGKVEGYIRLSELFHPEVIGISGCYGIGTIQSNPLNRRGPSFNTLLSIDDSTMDAVSAGQEGSARVKIYKKGR